MNHYIIQIALLVAALTWYTPSTAQEDEADVEIDTRKCLSTRRIRQVRIIDDRNVLFYISSKRIYQNELRQTCGGLKRLGSFSYNSSDGMMCEGDGISAAFGAWGDVRPIPGCWLGVHTRISKERADALRAASKRAPIIKAAPVPPPEPTDPSEKDTDPEDPES